MKAEDIREGMWLRNDRGDVGKVRVVFPGHAQATTLHGERPFWADRCEPWTPRVGEWVRWPGGNPWQVHTASGAGYSGVTAAGVGAYVSVGDTIEPCPPPEAKPAREMACEEHLDAIAAEPRGHNATCHKCGGRAYQGIGDIQCIEPVCDDPETREPQVVSEVMHYTSGKQYNDQRGEVVYEARGRGRALRHPTREGAIQAWREAVRRG